MNPSQDHPSPEPGSTPKSVGALDLDELFWQKIRTLPEEVKARPEIHGMLLFKSKTQQLNRDIEDAIELRLAGWPASMLHLLLRYQPRRAFAYLLTHWHRLTNRSRRLLNRLNQWLDDSLPVEIEHHDPIPF